MYSKLHVFVDFDGTISLTDTTDLLLQVCADPGWKAHEAAWERGEIGSRDCMAAQIALVAASPERLEAVLGQAPLDPGFVEFVRDCRARGIALTILSDGLDRSVALAMERLGVEVAIRANALNPAGPDRWRLDFPFSDTACVAGSGHCKCRSMAGGRAIKALIGDGRSDFCAAETADIVFAKARLIDHCRARGIPHHPFETFADLRSTFSGWLAALTDDAPGAIRAEQEITHAL